MKLRPSSTTTLTFGSLVDRAGEVTELPEHHVVGDDRDSPRRRRRGWRRRRSAVSRSRPPPGPMTSAVKTGEPWLGASHQVIRESGELVSQVFDLRQIAVERTMGVEAAESMSMNASRAWALVSRAQRPVAVRSVVHGDPRKRIPLAEEHRVGVVSLGVADIERRRAHQLQAAGNADDASAASSAVRAMAFAGENSSAATPPSTRRAARRPARRSD